MLAREILHFLIKVKMNVKLQKCDNIILNWSQINVINNHGFDLKAHFCRDVAAGGEGKLMH